MRRLALTASPPPFSLCSVQCRNDQVAEKQLTVSSAPSPAMDATNYKQCGDESGEFADVECAEGFACVKVGGRRSSSRS